MISIRKAFIKIQKQQKDMVASPTGKDFEGQISKIFKDCGFDKYLPDDKELKPYLKANKKKIQKKYGETPLKNELYKKSRAYADFFVMQPYGSQNYPDFIVFTKKNVYLIESKFVSGKAKKPVWNGNLPKADGIYIFGSFYEQKVTFFLGNDVLANKERLSILSLWDRTDKEFNQWKKKTVNNIIQKGSPFMKLFKKTYPYTDSTALIPVEPKRKRRKSKMLAPCLLSALLASIITASAIGVGGYYYLKPIKEQNASYVSSNAVSTGGATTTLFSDKYGALSVTEIAKKVGPACVGVINKAKVQPQRYFDPFSGRYYYYQNQASDELVEQGSGSGIIISNDGYIVTNQHVIADATEITVILNTGTEYTATLVGADSKSDLAVLKINANGLTAATLGDSSKVEVGDLAVAIGNPLGQELAGSVTAGVISAVNRKMTIDNRSYNLIQTDAAINPGNSGGALVNNKGEVIGINSVKMSQTGVEGIGFAIAMAEAKPIIDDLMNEGYVSGRSLIGINITESRNGLTVYSVQEGSGAAKAGLKEGDLIVKADGKVVTTGDALNEIRDTKKPGDYITLTIIRNGELTDVKVALMEDKPENNN